MNTAVLATGQVDSAPGPLLARLDVLDAEGQTRYSQVLRADADGCARLTVGRALDADLVLDDPQLAGHHAELFVAAQPLGRLQLLPSLNGALQGGKRCMAPAQLDWPHDGVLQLGQTRLRLRHAAGALAPEQAARPSRAARAWALGGALGLVLLGLALSLFDLWLEQAPDTSWRVSALALVGIATGVVSWALAWAALNQLFQRRFPFLQHLRWTLAALALSWLLSHLLPGAAYAWSRPALLGLAQVLDALVLCALLFVQGRSVWPAAQGRWAAVLVAGLAVSGLTLLWTREHEQHWLRPLYLSALPPPTLRLAPLRSPEALLQDAAALREELARKARLDPRTGEPQESADEDGAD